jgi:hypothetical protein
MNDIIVSSIVAQQLPDHVRGEYPNFVNFIQKYYEWMELNGNALQQSHELKTSYDVDLASNYYIEQMKKEFLPYFPEITTLDSRKFIKFASQFYKSKGTPESLKFLFKALYNEEVEVFYPKDDILRTSDGKWVLPLALRIDTDDLNILNTDNCILTGETSKSTALIEKAVSSVDRQLGISYIELYVSNVKRRFQTGEIVSATYNDGENDITVTGKLIGTLSQIRIDPNNRGLFYNEFSTITGYPGDPVTIVGGLNPVSNVPVGAIAHVGTTTKGGITDVLVVNPGFGFRNPIDDPNTSFVNFKNGFTNEIFGTEAQAEISLVDTSLRRTMNVSNKVIDTIISLTLDEASPTSNIQNSEISMLSTYQSFNVYPLAFAVITGSGGGYRSRPQVDVVSYYNEDNEDVLIVNSVNIGKSTNSITVFDVDLTSSFQVGDTARLFLRNRYDDLRKIVGVTSNTLTFEETFENDIPGVSIFKVLKSDLYQLGSLGRLIIDVAGEGYQVGEQLTFTGGSGYGASAVITEIHANTGIKSVEFLQTDEYVIGGEGYTNNNLPVVGVIHTSNGSNAVMRVSEICGNGEEFALVTSRIGSISTIRISSFGYDYVSSPTLSLRNADITLSNVTTGFVFVSNTSVYQGTSNTTPSFSAIVDQYNPNTNVLRIFDYKGTFDPLKLIFSDDGLISANAVSIVFYGDGKAKATANFENGLIRYPGLYLNTDGHLSEDKRMQDGEKYHNFSYVINTEQDYESFKGTLDNMIHPVGTKTFVNRFFNNSSDFISDIDTEIFTERLLEDFFIVTESSNVVTSMNTSSNLASIVSVGDVLIMEDLNKTLSGTVNTSNSSNNVIGTDTNFLNELQDGDLVYISTGDLGLVSSVESNNSIVTQNTINSNSTGSTINLIFNETKTISFVNANTIIVDSNFTTTASNVVVIHRKVE